MTSYFYLFFGVLVIIAPIISRLSLRENLSLSSTLKCYKRVANDPSALEERLKLRREIIVQWIAKQTPYTWSLTVSKSFMYRSGSVFEKELHTTILNFQGNFPSLSFVVVTCLLISFRRKNLEKSLHLDLFQCFLQENCSSIDNRNVQLLVIEIFF